MTKKIPTYDPTTKIQPAIQPYSKGFDEWSSDFEKLGKQENSLRVQDVDFDTMQEAREAGANPNFKEESPKTREDKIFERQALQSNQIALSNQVRSHALELRDQLTAPGSLTPNSGAEFHAQMNDYLANVVETAPEGNKEYIKNMGERYIDSIGESVNVQSKSLAKSNLRFNLYQYIDGNMQTAMRDAMDGSAKGAIDASALYGQIHAKVSSAVASGYMPGEQAASLLARSQQQLQVMSVMGKFRNDLNAGNGEESLIQFMQNPPSDMAPAQYKQALSMMQGMIQTKINAQKLNDQMITQQTQSIFDQVASGDIDPNSADVSEAYQNAQSLGPAQGDKFNAGLQQATVKGTLAKATQFITPAQADQTSTMLMQKLNPNSPHYQTQVDAINEAKLAVYKNWKIFASDPANYALQAPMVQQAIQASSTEPTIPFKSGGITSGSQFLNTDSYKAIINTELQMGAQENPTTKGIPQISLIPKATAKNMAAALNSMSIDEQTANLRGIETQYPQYASIILRDLSNGGWSMANQLFYALSQTNPAKQFNAINSMRMTKKDMDTLTPKQMNSIKSSVNSYLSDYNQSFNNYALPSPDRLTQTNDFLNRLAAYYIFSGKTTDPDTAASMAYNDLIPNLWSFTNPDGRSPLRLPVDISPDKVRLAMTYIVHTDISPASNFYYQNKPISHSENYYDGVVQNGKWINLPDNSGIVLTDETGNPVKVMRKGKLLFVGFKFDGLRNPNSKISQGIDQFLMAKDIAYSLPYHEF